MAVASEKVFEQLREVQQSGRVNMIDRKGVQFVANQMKLYSLVVWIHENENKYGDLLVEFGDWLEAEETAQ